MAAILARFGGGLLDGPPGDEPLLAVELQGSWPLTVPALFPAVVAGVGVPGRDLPAGCDVVVTEHPDPPAPWVGVADAAAALAELRARVGEFPLAATSLAQLLRLGEGRAPDDGLALESLCYSVLQGGPEFARWLAARPGALSPEEGGEAVVVQRRGDVLEVLLDRPHVHNAYNRAMRDALCRALAVAVADPSVEVALAGRGPSFCSGGDLSEFGTAPDPVSAHLVRTARSPARLLAGLSERVTAVIHGACAGSGIELPAFAATVRARPGTRIWLPELAMGLIPGAGGTVSLARRIGRHRTAWLVLTGRAIDAATAFRWGLVDELLDA